MLRVGSNKEIADWSGGLLEVTESKPAKVNGTGS